MENLWLLWLAVAVVALVIEFMTTALVSVWVCAGALVAMILALCGADILVQIIAMAVVTVITFIICMIWIKPKLDERHRVNVEPTNADRVLGKEGLVTVTINPIEGKGQVKVIGQTWSAKSDRQIEQGRKIRVTGMEGVKLIVEEIV